jgi:hypothetical protein
MMKKIYLCFLIGITLLFASCYEKTLDPISESSGKPGGITEITATPIAGGVIVSYRIPSSSDVLAVKAVYTLTNGEKRESSASFYNSQLEIIGYKDVLEHEALFYTISRSQELSDPVSVKFTPLKSPIVKAIESVKIVADFGGANFSWKNEDQAPLTVEILTQDSITKMMQIARIYSSTDDSASYTLRGFPIAPQKFGILISDIYGNISDTIYPPQGLLTPLYEEKLDKKIQQIRIISGDVSFTNWEGQDVFIIDDDLGTFGHSYTATVPGASFTLDLGKKAKLSRFVYHQRSDGDRYFRVGNPRTFEVFAYTGDNINDLGNPPGNWSNWELVVSALIIKPSGLPNNEKTDEDYAAAEPGHDFAFPLSLEAVQYLRFRVIECFGANYWHPGEITMMGEYFE